MQLKIRKNLQKILLIWIVLSFLTAAATTPIMSQTISTTISKQHQLERKENTLNTMITEQNTDTNKTPNLCYTIQYSLKDLTFTTMQGFDLISLQQCSLLSEIGKPMLPVQHLLIALPAGRKATHIHVLSARTQTLPGFYSIMPAQQPRNLVTQLNQFSFNKSMYLLPLPYPSSPIRLGTQTDLAGQGMVHVSIFPLRYLPLQQKITLITSIDFVIETTQGYICQDYLAESTSEDQLALYEQMIKGMVFNPEDVTLSVSHNPVPLGVEPGDYDYVIITQASWVNAFQPLADWKTQKGVPARIVTTDWIYNQGGYSGTNVQKIKAFVQDAYTTWGTTYVLLGGDSTVVPCHFKTFSGVDPDPVPNDAYYADFDADWICEVNVGRASVTGPGNGTGQIGNFIDKILTYEISPPLTNYAKNAGFFGFDLDSWTEAEQCKINIDNAYIPSSWTMTNVYDSQGGNHKTNVITALNAGQHLANHADHSNTDCMGVGYVNHDLLLYTDDMDALTNGEKQTILYSMGCDPAAFDVSNCIAEHFVRNSNGGGIAFIGNTRYGWYNYGTYDTLSMGFDVHFFKSLLQENFYHLGAAFSDHKNDAYQEDPGDNYYKYIFTELTLLGDPELPVWTENPDSLIVSHPSTLPLTPSSFIVHAETTSGSPLQNAFVCLWKNDEVYERGFTNDTGDVSFTISPLSGGNMLVTVTKHNYLPSETTVYVLEDNLPPYEPSSPDPQQGATNIPLSCVLSWTGGDPNPGDTVLYDVYFGTTTSPPKVSSNQSATMYNPGALDYLTTYHWMIVAWDDSGESTPGSVWEFTTKANNQPVFGAPSPANGSTGNPTSITWAIPITDPDSDLISWTIHCSNGQSASGSSATNGTKTLLLSGLLYAMTYTIWVNATDPSGSGSYTRRWYTFSTLSDSTPPVTTILLEGTMGQNPWFISAVTITLSATDDIIGVDYTMYRIDQGDWELYISPILVSNDGEHTIEYYSVDILGNTETVQSTVFNIDQTSPMTTHQFSGDEGLNGWYFSVSFSLNSVDTTSGVNHTYYRIDDGEWLLYTTPVVIESDGIHALYYHSMDNAGNNEQVKGPFSFKLDQTSPELTLVKQQIDLFTVQFIAQAQDETSGVAYVEFLLDGQLQTTDTQAPYEWTLTTFEQYSVTATVYDNAGNTQSQTMSTPYSFHVVSLLHQPCVQGDFLKSSINQ
jgi:hypothetical protein